MSTKIAATFYYDIISPFAYLYIKQRQRLESVLLIMFGRKVKTPTYLGQNFVAI
jgi:2-hydroxychromene-2-carboxylate isomerase